MSQSEDSHFNVYLDHLLDEMRTSLGTDFDRYRNHVYRLINYTDQFVTLQDERLEQVAIAACFHDAGIWLDHTFDYLEPSRHRAEEYVRSLGHTDWDNVVSAMIMNHHRIRPVRSNPLVEAFRRADWLDVSKGVINFGITRDVVEQVTSAYPYAGFQARLVQLTLHRVRRFPLNPLPMMRW